MKNDLIQTITGGNFTDPETLEPVFVPTGVVVSEKNLRGMEQDLIKTLGFGRRLAVSISFVFRRYNSGGGSG